MIEWSEIVLRLGVATLAGGAIGLNRDLHGKPIGVRTLGLVSLASAVVVMLADPGDSVGRITDATSRVIQGILTGIGFLGAGVIMRSPHRARVRGLTSAACTWLTACVGIVCGTGQWRIVGVALAIAFVILLTGGPLERTLHRLLGGKDEQAAKPSAEPGPNDSENPGEPPIGA
ncbi:putative Mg2+ transporter-C (MgtC) family protein [Rhodopseudomonas rhenobacensis]|uniref:Protein MgtC n=1 Tax=Rhodopseudomonas rhenobacensis TaxID=87461 RepID=A0A7W8E1P6_9BRAD|nr:putative Mg2+ transporter-C (MgtC) family protein [Rhodopseudomonas rhenobacensis]